MSIMVVTADLGHFKAYKINEDPLGRPIIDLIESYDSIEGHGKLGDKLSDVAGRFRGGAGKDESAKGFGEFHHLESDIREKAEKDIAASINEIIGKECPDSWYLAAPERINNEIVKHLKPKIKARMVKNISADLTKTPEAELLVHFR